MEIWIWMLLTVAIFVIGREFWLLIWLPAKAKLLNERGDRQQACKILEQRLNAFSLLGERSKIADRILLALLYLTDRRYDEAIEQCQKLLAQRLKPSVEAEVRHILANCLEAIGKVKEADAERQKAEEYLASAPSDFAKLMTKGKMLEEEGRFAEAYDALKQALGLLPKRDRIRRPVYLLRLAILAFRLGRANETVQLAEEAITLQPELNILHHAHRIAALGCSSLGDLERQEEHLNRALAISMALQNKEKIAGDLVGLASVWWKRGEFVKAMEACEQAAQTSLKVRRQARLVQAEILKLWGRYEEAIDLLKQASRAEPLPFVSLERVHQVFISLAIAQIEAERGHADEAMRLLEEIKDVANQDPKASLIWTATLSWVQAMSGRHQEAVATFVEAEKRLMDEFPNDRTVQTDVYALVGKALLIAGDLRTSIDCWERCLKANPIPVFRPTILYHLGECYFQQGEIERAKEVWQEASSCGFDTAYARKAQKRLEELDEQGAKGETKDAKASGQ